MIEDAIRTEGVKWSEDNANCDVKKPQRRVQISMLRSTPSKLEAAVARPSNVDTDATALQTIADGHHACG